MNRSRLAGIVLRSGGVKHPKVRVCRHIDKIGIATRQKCDRRRQAERSRHIEARQPRTFFRNLIDARCANVIGFQATEVSVALVVCEDDNEVKLRGRSLFSLREVDFAQIPFSGWEFSVGNSGDSHYGLSPDTRQALHRRTQNRPP